MRFVAWMVPRLICSHRPFLSRCNGRLGSPQDPKIQLDRSLGVEGSRHRHQPGRSQLLVGVELFYVLVEGCQTVVGSSRHGGHDANACLLVLAALVCLQTDSDSGFVREGRRLGGWISSLHGEKGRCPV